jgi:hypothetical protein
MQHALRVTAAFLTASMLAACSGASGGGPPPPTAPQSKTAQVTFRVAKPTKTAPGLERAYERVRKMHPHFVSPNTATMTFTLTKVNGLTPPSGFNTTTTLHFSGGSQNCTLTGGVEQCSITTSAPVALDTWTVTGLSSTSATLSTSSITQNIAVGANAVNLTLNPVVASLAWSTPSANISNGIASGAVPEQLEALDATGAIIIPVVTGTNAFQIPLYLKSDGLTIDYLGYQCSSANLALYNSSGLTTAAQGNTAAFTDGVAISTPDSTQTGTNTQKTPGGATITAVGNDGVDVGYDGTAQSGATASLTCTANDSQGRPAAVATFTLQNGTVTWTVN